MGWAQPSKPDPELLQRRAGRADAAVLLVAKRIAPTMTLDDWGKHLELTHQDLAAAVDRFKARTMRPQLRSVPTGRRNKGRPALPPDERAARDRYILHLHSQGETVTAIARQVGLTPARVSQIVHR